MAHFNRNKYLRKMKLKKYGKYFYLGIIGILCFSLGVYFTYSKYNVSKEEEVVRTTVGNFISGDVVIGAYINGEYSKEIPRKSDGYIAEKVVCDNNAIGTWNYEEWSLTTKNITTRSKCNVYFIDGYSKNFDYTKSVQEFVAPRDGIYKLEVWGAQGGNSLDNGVLSSNKYYAGYSKSNIKLNKNDKLYVTVGGRGEDGKLNNIAKGGFNGGGNGTWDHNDDEAGAGGGGATSIQNSLLGDGQLKNYENNKSSVLIVAGGSAGNGMTVHSDYFSKYKFSYGGGFIGGVGGTTKAGNSNDYTIFNAATQDNGYTFGLGQSTDDITGNYNQEAPGAGGGWYGGLALTNTVAATLPYSYAGGGSGYIGNSLLTNKAMYCYNCEESNEESTKTISTTCTSETPTENCAKKGNGYARITLISVD